MSEQYSVYKYELPITDYVEKMLPKRAQILKVGVQRDIICIWALISVKEPEREIRTFRIAGTGHPIDEAELLKSKYLDTVMIFDGKLVFHVFELTE